MESVNGITQRAASASEQMASMAARPQGVVTRFKLDDGEKQVAAPRTTPKKK